MIKTGKSMSAIVMVSVWRINKAYKERHGIVGHKGQGRPFSVVNKELVDKVRKQAHRNHFENVSGLARFMNMSPSYMRSVVTVAGLRSMAPKVHHKFFPGQRSC